MEFRILIVGRKVIRRKSQVEKVLCAEVQSTGLFTITLHSGGKKLGNAGFYR